MASPTRDSVTALMPADPCDVSPTASEWTLAILMHSPHHAVTGTVRLHGLCHLLAYAGCPLPMTFSIHRNTVCSDDLTITLNALIETKQIAWNWVPSTDLRQELRRYRILSPQSHTALSFPPSTRALLGQLTGYDTHLIAEASLVAHSLQQGKERQVVMRSLASQSSFRDIDHLSTHIDHILHTCEFQRPFMTLAASNL